ncbi:cyanophycin synthetase family protein [Brevundimonas intermedia]|uniref:cyanophycin synthetase family protein n=1 Tax=Brevundimonas intermedia TaxID=74315 RepID=UPI003D7A5F4A
MEGRPTGQFRGFTTTPLERQTRRQEHGCAFQRPDGLHKRMSDGMWFGERIEHVALESQALTGARTGWRPRLGRVLACRVR